MHKRLLLAHPAAAVLMAFARPPCLSSARGLLAADRTRAPLWPLRCATECTDRSATQSPCRADGCLRACWRTCTGSSLCAPRTGWPRPRQPRGRGTWEVRGVRVCGVAWHGVCGSRGGGGGAWCVRGVWQVCGKSMWHGARCGHGAFVGVESAWHVAVGQVGGVRHAPLVSRGGFTTSPPPPLRYATNHQPPPLHHYHRSLHGHARAVGWRGCAAGEHQDARPVARRLLAGRRAAALRLHQRAAGAEGAARGQVHQLPAGGARGCAFACACVCVCVCTLCMCVHARCVPGACSITRSHVAKCAVSHMPLELQSTRQWFHLQDVCSNKPLGAKGPL